MADLSGFRVAVLATDGFEETELTEPVKALKGAGADVTILSLEPGDIQGFRHDINKSKKVRADRALRDVSPGEFDGAVLPGGTVNADSMRMVPQVQAFLREMQEAGKPRAASVIKLAGNFLLGAAIEAMAEAFTLAEKHGVPRRHTYEFFTQTLCDCFVYRGYGELVASEHYQPVGARPSLIRKDYGLILEAAAEGLVPMPLAHLIHERLTATVAKGREDADWAGFAREVSESAGL